VIALESVSLRPGGRCVTDPRAVRGLLANMDAEQSRNCGAETERIGSRVHPEVEIQRDRAGWGIGYALSSRSGSGSERSSRPMRRQWCREDRQMSDSLESAGRRCRVRARADRVAAYCGRTAKPRFTHAATLRHEPEQTVPDCDYEGRVVGRSRKHRRGPETGPDYARLRPASYRCRRSRASAMTQSADRERGIEFAPRSTTCAIGCRGAPSRDRCLGAKVLVDKQTDRIIGCKLGARHARIDHILASR